MKRPIILRKPYSASEFLEKFVEEIKRSIEEDVAVSDKSNVV